MHFSSHFHTLISYQKWLFLQHLTGDHSSTMVSSGLHCQHRSWTCVPLSRKWYLLLYSGLVQPSRLELTTAFWNIYVSGERERGSERERVCVCRHNMTPAALKQRFFPGCVCVCVCKALFFSVNKVVVSLQMSFTDHCQCSIKISFWCFIKTNMIF